MRRAGQWTRNPPAGRNPATAGRVNRKPRRRQSLLVPGMGDQGAFGRLIAPPRRIWRRAASRASRFQPVSADTATPSGGARLRLRSHLFQTTSAGRSASVRRRAVILRRFAGRGV